jgi:hypothetical protein
MQKRSLFSIPLAFLVASFLPAGCFGQTTSLPRFGVGVTAGTLGAGIEAATAVTKKSNVRFGYNYFSYSGNTSKDNIAYDGKLRLESAELLYDQYIVSGLHISGGLMMYDGNQGTATASVPGGQTFSLNGQQYYSDASDPVHGTGAITSRKVAPEVLIGFGNLLPRSAHHFSVGFEVGVAFQGSPNAKLNLTGSTCLSGASVGCLPISSNPLVQTNVLGEQNKVNNDLAPFKYYPVVRLAFGYKF